MAYGWREIRDLLWSIYPLAIMKFGTSDTDTFIASSLNELGSSMEGPRLMISTQDSHRGFTKWIFAVVRKNFSPQGLLSVTIPKDIGHKRFGTLRLMCFIAVVFLLSLSGFQIWRAEALPVSQPKTKLDVVLLFDSSGSMLTTDPSDLRVQGAELLFSFLREDDQLGIVSFADSARVERELQMFSPSRLGVISGEIKGIKTSGLYTDIAAGISLAKTLLQSSGRDDAQQVIVLVSDGKNEPDPKNGPAVNATLQLVHNLLPDLRAKEVKIFTMALSESADRAFLGELSAATSGLTWFAKDTEAIHKAYADLFLALKRPQILNQKGHNFVLEEEFSEVTFYINHQAEETLTLVTPRGSSLTEELHPDYVVWHRANKFDVITVKLPDQGTWQVVGTEEQDGFVALLTDLRVYTDWPISVYEGEENLLQARLYDANKPVVIPEMSQLVKVGFQIIPMDKVAYPIMQEMLNDEGRHGDVIAGDGIFSVRTKEIPQGSYRLKVSAKGPTFNRSQQIPFVVHPRLVTLSIGDHDENSVEHTTGESHGSAIDGNSDTRFSVELSREATGYRDIKIFLSLKSEQGRHLKIPVEDRRSLRIFGATAAEISEKGTYVVQALLEAKDKKGKAIYAKSNSITFTLEDIVEQPHTDSAHKHVEPETKTATLRIRDVLAPIGILTILNLLMVVGAVAFIKKKTRKKKEGLQRYIPTKQLIDAVATMEQIAAQKEVDFTQPVFSSVIDEMLQDSELTIQSDESAEESEPSTVDETVSDKENNPPSEAEPEPQIDTVNPEEQTQEVDAQLPSEEDPKEGS